jgi:plastocyanin
MTLRLGLCAGLAIVGLACGGGSSGGGGGTTPTAPTNPTNPNPPAPVATTTITISNNAVNPQRIVVPVGSRVTFVNNDNRTHEMNSDPHPNHGDCPAIDDVGFLAPGQSKQTGNLTVARTCGFHDHNQPTVAGLTGQIIVQ